MHQSFQTRVKGETMNDILKLSDSELALRLEELRRESRRRLGGATFDFSDIRGNEMAKRAATVALAGNHSILFIGPSGCGKTMLRAAMLAVDPDAVAYESRICPCGNYSNPNKPCGCTVEDIRGHLSKIPVADITVELYNPSEREMNGRLLGTSTANVIQQVKQSVRHDSLTLDREGQLILKASVAELGISAAERATILAVARTIANMEDMTAIESRHLCEAINYRAIMHYAGRVNK